jgi:poly(A) polymerase Pap1
MGNKDDLDITGMDTDKIEIEEKVKDDTQAKPLYKNPRWHLICSTVEEWQEVADSLKYSTTKEAKELYKCIVNDFLPEMPAIMEARVSNSCTCFVALVSYQKCNLIKVGCFCIFFFLHFILGWYTNIYKKNNNILFGVMSSNFSVIFDPPIIYRTVKHIDNSS